MTDQWYYRLFGEEFGPVSVETLQSLMESGTLGDSDDVRPDGSSAWTSVAQAFGESATAPAATATATAGTDDDQQWYCQLLGQELGPLSFEELVKFAENGELSADDDVRFGASGKWRKVGSIGRLVSVLPFRESQALRPAQTTVPSTKPAAGSESAPRPTAATEIPAPRPTAPAAARSRKSDPLVEAVADTAPTAIAPTVAVPTVAAPVKPSATPSTATSDAASKLLASAVEQFAAAAPSPSRAEPRPSGSAAPRPASSGFGGAPSSSAASAWSAPAKPVARPPAKKPAPSRAPTDWGAMLGPFKSPKALVAMGLIFVAVLLLFGGSLLPQGTGADLEKLEQLQQILTDLRKLRDSKAGESEWSEFAKKAEETGKAISDELEKTASRKNPARQYMLWASRNRLPGMLQGSRDKASVDEEHFEANLYDAAQKLGVAKGEPPKGSIAARPPVVDSEEGDGTAE